MSFNLRKILFHWDREKLNKISRFVQSLFKEINEEIAKLFDEKGILKILVIIFLSYLFYQFYPESIPYTVVVLIFILGLIKIKLGEESKISIVIIILGGLALGLVLFGGLWLLIIEPIIDWISTLFS